jgi:hypothetical protein
MNKGMHVDMEMNMDMDMGTHMEMNMNMNINLGMHIFSRKQRRLLSIRGRVGVELGVPRA